MVCDDQCRIRTINPKFGGANHDSFIWDNSDLNIYMQSLHHNGDSGYPLRPWLMTPILDPNPNFVAVLFNKKHTTARVLIENTFSRLKNLHKDRVLYYKLLKCARIILACSVLHNMLVNLGITDLEEEGYIDLAFKPISEHEMHTEREAKLNKRSEINKKKERFQEN